MRKINYRLIVSDFDGTLADSNNNVPVKVRSAISEYVANGGIFAVCTGRMLRSILPRVHELGLKGLVVAYQGTVIADIESGQLIKNGGIDTRGAAGICRCLETFGAVVNVYSDNIMYTSLPKDNGHLRLYENITGIDAVSVTERSLSAFVEERGLVCQKITSLVAPKDRENLYGTINAELGEKYDVTCSADVLVEISPKGDDKGRALTFLAEYFNIPLSSTVAVGDNLNDLSMIKIAGLGVAVGNATPKLKEAADVVTVTNNECAVAKIIEKYGFE